MNNNQKSKLVMISIPIMYVISYAITLLFFANKVELTHLWIIFIGLGACLSAPFFYLISYYADENRKDVAKSTSCPKCKQPLIYIPPTWTQNGYNFCNSCKEKLL